jgi:outer membrane lipoprotein
MSNKEKTMKTVFFYCSLALLCAACASQPPLPIRVELPANPTFLQVHNNTSKYINQPVRWGGTIHSIKNLKNKTELEIIYKPLDSSAYPDYYAKSPGRFLAIVDGFLDPSDFEADRQITVVGTVQGETTRPIGEFDYRYPVIHVKSYYLWTERTIPARAYPYYYDYPYYPYWYDPWYGWYRPYPWWY